ncbi:MULTISPECIES: hypothetical protein [unclassified Microcoleus]|uniref:hypothetical protein n=1 Tax=unclassified Microcoleus TaxID=2642155 RepID=UPI002FD717DB
MVSVPNFKLPRQEQHDRIFLQDAIDRYKNRLLTAAGYIYTIIKIYRQAGHRLNIPSPRSFYEYFQIPKSTFYRALIQLENTPGIQFQWESIGGISMWWGGEEPPAAAAAVEPPAAAVEPPAAAVEPPAAAEPKYQRLNQLPGDTKEKFEAFVRSQWRKLKGQEIRSFHRFVEKPGDFQDWWQKFRACPPPQAQKPAPITETEPAITEEPPLSPEERSQRFRQLRQLIESKKNERPNAFNATTAGKTHP